MILNDGSIFFKQFNETLFPMMKHEDFIKTAVFKNSVNVTITAPYWTYQTPSVISNEKIITFKLWFLKSECLTKIEFWDANEKYGSSWEDYSEQKENQRNESGREWLIKECGIKPGKYEWGSIDLVLDAHYGIYCWMIIYHKT